MEGNANIITFGRWENAPSSESLVIIANQKNHALSDFLVLVLFVNIQKTYLYFCLFLLFSVLF